MYLQGTLNNVLVDLYIHDEKDPVPDGESLIIFCDN